MQRRSSSMVENIFALFGFEHKRLIRFENQSRLQQQLMQNDEIETQQIFFVKKRDCCCCF